LWFSGSQHLAKWLTQAAAGRDVLQEVEAKWCDGCRHRRPVLVKVYRDGWVEAYAEKGVDVMITNRIHTAPEAEHLADAYLADFLPRRFRAVFRHESVRASEWCRQCTGRQAVLIVLRWPTWVDVYTRGCEVRVARVPEDHATLTAEAANAEEERINSRLPPRFVDIQTAPNCSVGGFEKRTFAKEVHRLIGVKILEAIQAGTLTDPIDLELVLAAWRGEVPL
jgi:hypothetical protein